MSAPLYEEGHLTGGGCQRGGVAVKTCDDRIDGIAVFFVQRAGQQPGDRVFGLSSCRGEQPIAEVAIATILSAEPT